MPQIIDAPTIIEAAGNKPKRATVYLLAGSSGSPLTRVSINLRGWGGRRTCTLSPRSSQAVAIGRPTIVSRRGRRQPARSVSIELKRVYEQPSPEDGCRVLVERLWPRGLSKRDAKIDLWAKEAAPSTDLRRWFNHEPDRWVEFRRRYFEELRVRDGVVLPILERLRAGRVTFVFASREPRFNNAVALKEYVERGPE